MSTGSDPASDSSEQREPTEDELRAAYEAQIKQVRIEHVLLENLVTVLNLGMRRTGLLPGTEDERDAEQVRLAIESIRAQVPLIEQVAPSRVSQIREALSQLQLAFVKIGGPAAGAAASPSGRPEGDAEPGGGPSAEPIAEPSPDSGGPPDEETGEQPPKRDEPGPAEASGRLWVPGR